MSGEVRLPDNKATSTLADYRCRPAGRLSAVPIPSSTDLNVTPEAELKFKKAKGADRRR